jgi:nucleotide-binding universal stress UspA family protein
MTGKPIVAATDGSEESLQAVEWAAGEAVLHAVPLRIVSATSPLPWMTGLQVRPDRDHVADLIRAEREQALDTAASKAARVAPGLVIMTDPLDGVPAHAVTESGYGASMLVVGSRGAGAFTPMMLGSVSRYVAARAACPVVVVRDQLPVRSRQVGIGIGDPDDCADAVTFAFEEAGLRKVGLLAVHACYAPQASLSRAGSAWPVPGPVEAEAARKLTELLDRWREKYPGVPVSLDVMHGHPGRALVGLSARVGLVVIGRRAGHSRVPGPGTVRHAILSHAHGPVAVIPSGK